MSSLVANSRSASNIPSSRTI